MSILRITNGFDRLNDADLKAKASAIDVAMSGNANFTTPSPTLTVLEQAILDFSLALSKAKNGSILDKAIKNEKRAELVTLLHSLGNYVLFTVNGDKVKAVSSGFTIAKEQEPRPPITNPENLQVSEGANSGELNIKFKRVLGARSYMIQYAQDPVTPATNWQSQVCTTSKCIIKQLESGKKYQVRVAAVGTNEQLLYSDPVTRVVQ